jgi:cellobiose-specific phosphotransferase system component IIA
LKRFNIKSLSLDELSVVGKPANPGARVALFKTKEPELNNDEGDTVMSKTLEEALAEIEEGKGELKKAENAIEQLTKALEETHVIQKSADGDITVAKKQAEEMIEFDGQMIAKSAVPAPILKALETQAKDLADLRKKAETEDLRKSAEATFPNLAGNVEAKVGLMKALNSLPDTEKDEVLKSLKAADAAVAGLFKERGNSAADENSPAQKLEKMAHDYAKANSVTYEIAFSEVTKSGDGAALYKSLRQQ